MQSQVVHQHKAYIPWIPMLVAALLVVATALSIQLALRDRGTTVAPSIATVDQINDPGAGRMANHATDMQARGGAAVLPHEGRGPFADGASLEAAGRDEAWKVTLPKVTVTPWGKPR